MPFNQCCRSVKKESRRDSGTLVNATHSLGHEKSFDLFLVSIGLRDSSFSRIFSTDVKYFPSWIGTNDH
jgi:hypothetical protein